MTFLHPRSLIRHLRGAPGALGLAAVFSLIAAAPASGQLDPTPARSRLVSVNDVIQMVLTNNLDILINQYVPVLDQITLAGLSAPYDPVFSISASRSLTTAAGGFFQGTFFPAYSTVTRNYNPGLSGTLPTGLSYSLSTPLTDYTTPFTQYNAGPLLQLSQPLLKNFLIDNTRYQIKLARQTLRSDQFALRLQIMTAVNNAKAAYYNLIAARENVQVEVAAVDLAQQLVDQNTKKVQLGALAPLDQRQAESQAATSQSDLLNAQLTQTQQENSLKALMALHLSDWDDVTPVPSGALLAVPETPNLQESLRQALAARPDMLQAKISLEKQHLTIRYTKNQLYPEVDLTGSYGRNATGATFGQTFDIVRNGTDPNYAYGVLITMPLDNLAARSTHRAAQATLEQLLLQVKKTETTIVLAVDNDVKTVRSDLLRVDATRKAREYAEEALKAAQTRLQAGSTTSFEVLQLQSTLTTARSAEIRARADYNIALEQLALDDGTILERNHIDLKMP